MKVLLRKGSFNVKSLCWEKHKMIASNFDVIGLIPGWCSHSNKSCKSRMSAQQTLNTQRRDCPLS